MNYKLQLCRLKTAVLFLIIFFSSSFSSIARNKIKISEKTISTDSIINEKNEDYKYFVDPITAATMIMGTVKLMSSFFSSENSGPNVIDFITVTNQKIDIINDKLDQVINDLSEIDKKINIVPSLTVAEFRKNELKSAIIAYQGVFSTLITAKYRGDINTYMQEKVNLTKIKDLTDKIDNVRTSLEALNYDPFTVPFVSIAMNMEYTLKKKFLHVDIYDMAGDMAKDREYLMKYLFNDPNSLNTILTGLFNTRDKFLKQINAPHLIQYSFSTDRIFGNKIIAIQMDFSPTPGMFGVVDPNVGLLYDIGIIPRNISNIPLVYAQTFILDNGFQGGDGSILQNQDLPLPIDFKTTKENFNSDLKKFLNQKSADYKDFLDLNFTEIESIASAFYLGLKELELCNFCVNASKQIKINP